MRRRCVLCGKPGDTRRIPLCPSHRLEFTLSKFKAACDMEWLEGKAKEHRVVSDRYRLVFVEQYTVNAEVPHVGECVV